MSDFREDLLTAILDCGYGDLYLLEGCRYDIGEIVEECMQICNRLEINTLVRIMFEFGLSDIDTARNDRICEIEAIQNERELDEEEEIELRMLRKMEPLRDFASYHNYIDTHIWLATKENGDAYQRYLGNAIKNFREMTGFEIGFDYTISV